MVVSVFLSANSVYAEETAASIPATTTDRAVTLTSTSSSSQISREQEVKVTSQPPTSVSSQAAPKSTPTSLTEAISSAITPLQRKNTF